MRWTRRRRSCSGRSRSNGGRRRRPQRPRQRAAGLRPRRCRDHRLSARCRAAILSGPRLTSISARHYGSKGDLEGAAEALGRAAALRPDHAGTLLRMGLVRHAQGDLDVRRKPASAGRSPSSPRAPRPASHSETFSMPRAGSTRPSRRMGRRRRSGRTSSTPRSRSGNRATSTPISIAAIRERRSRLATTCWRGSRARAARSR